MIFSKFFKPTWQHKDSTNRIHAIETELSVESGEDFKVLQQLATNDESELVRRAALLKINSFSSWFEHSKQNSLNSIREFCHQQVELVLHGKHAISLDEKDKKQFLNQDLKANLLEGWLKEENNPEVVVELFKRLKKPQLLFTVFKQHQEENVQLQLLSLVDDASIYEKLLKASAGNKVTEKLNALIQAEKEKVEKPNRITKSTQLLLSKYLALKDSKDYQISLEKIKVYEQEWDILIKDFDCLAQGQQEANKNKFNDIQQQVKKSLAPLAEVYEQEKIAKQLQDDRQNALIDFDKQVNQFEKMITESIFENSTIDEDKTLGELNVLLGNVENSILTAEDKKALSKNILAIKDKLGKLSVVAQAVTDATHLISKMSQVSLPETIEELNEKSGDFYAWCRDWQNVEKSAGSILPDSIKTAFSEIKTAWKKALTPLEQAQKKQFHVAGKKISDVKRLINNGKYNAAFGVFKKASSLYEALNEYQQHKLKRDYQQIKDKLDDLSDWEHYIATPKKQELVNQIESLANNPLDNPAEQAKKVKEYRHLWNSLGHAEDELEKDLNEQFNKFSEIAFAPCRLFFAEQEKVRETHLTKRKELIEDAKNFAATYQTLIENNEWKKIEANLNRIRQSWRDAGEVDRNVYQALNTQFKSTVEPIKNAVAEKHQQSIDQKNAIIEKALLLLELEDVYQASQDVKQLQQEWKQTGYSGPKQENALWKQFRSINDKLFDKRGQQLNEQKQIDQQQEEAFISQIEEEISSLDKTSLESLSQVTRNLVDIKTSIENKGIKSKRSLQLIKKELSQLSNLKQQIAVNEQKQNWAVVFDAMLHMVNNDLESFKHFSTLSNEWQKRLLDVSKQSAATFEQRLDKTLLLEILATKESPKEEQQRRLQLQLEVMQQQLNSGQLESLEQGLTQWLNVGKFAEHDLPLINRAKAIFTS